MKKCKHCQNEVKELHRLGKKWMCFECKKQEVLKTCFDMDIRQMMSKEGLTLPNGNVVKIAG